MLLCIDNSIVCTGKLSGIYRDPKGSVKSIFYFQVSVNDTVEKAVTKGALKNTMCGSINFSPSYNSAG